nr:transposase, MuDR, MULE transposase domain protein [Tanacetum cinerariifolium]
MFLNFLESTTLENKGPSNPEIPSSHFNENHESSFDFRSNEYNTEDVTPVYKAKPNISKQCSQQSEVQKGKIFYNKESLILAVRLKAVSEEKKNEGTVTRIKTDDNRVFEMLFIAIGASIRTFLNYLRPVLMIDAAHSKGLYKGTNLVVVAMDGNNQIVPIVFGL